MLQMGCGMDGYIELKPDWKGSLEAMTAAADGADGGVGVDGGPTGNEPFDESPPLLLFPGVTEPPLLDMPCPPVWSVVMLPPFPLDGVTLCDPPLSCDDKTVLPLLPLLPPGSRFWLRSFSSRRHFARRFENQTFKENDEMEMIFNDFF